MWCAVKRIFSFIHLYKLFAFVGRSSQQAPTDPDPRTARARPGAGDGLSVLAEEVPRQAGHIPSAAQERNDT